MTQNEGATIFFPNQILIEGAFVGPKLYRLSSLSLVIFYPTIFERIIRLDFLYRDLIPPQALQCVSGRTRMRISCRKLSD